MADVKKAILTAKIEGELRELMIKTNVENVYVDETTTLATKLAEMLTSIDAKATSAQITEAVNSLKQEMLGDTPVEAYNTFTEMAAYIAEHKDAADALTAAIGNKADSSTVEAIQQTINALGSLANKNEVSEDDLSTELKEKVNAAAEGNHAHLNKTELDKIEVGDVEKWNSKSTVYYGSSTDDFENMAEGDLGVILVD